MSNVFGVGSEFAGYRIDEQLARGGMSEVYLAHNPRLGNKVVLKLLAPELAEDATFRERFVRESRTVASLDHPNVIPIHDAGEFDGQAYIVMRYVQGPDLKGLIRREGQLPLERALSIIGQVAGALDRAHVSGLIHRDVKPGNILIDERGDDQTSDHVYLTDFGVAKHTLSRSGLTMTGQFVGTIDYVAPEQIEGKTLDGRTDVYSLGCVLYEALTGMPPFERESNAALVYAHLLEPPPSVHERRPELPVELDAVIATALAKSPEARYPTAKALVEAARAAAEPVTNLNVAGGAASTVLSATVAAPQTVPALAEATLVTPQTVAPQATVAAPQARRAEARPPFMPATPQLPAQRRRFFSKRVAIAAVVLVLATAAAASAQTLMGSSDNDSTRNQGDGVPAGNLIDDPQEYELRERRRKAQARAATQRSQRIEQQRVRQQRAAKEQSDRIRTGSRPSSDTDDRIRSGSGSSSGGSGSGGDRLRPPPPPSGAGDDRLR